MNSSKKAKQQPLFFYGWTIILIAFITLGMAFGVWYSFSVFFLAIAEEFHWNRAATSSIFSVFIFSHAVMGLITGILQDRFGPRIVIPFGSLLLAIALFLSSQAHKLWQFYFFYGVCAGAGVSLIGFISHSAFVPKWFEQKRGLAVGLAMSGIGFGMLLLVPLIEQLISIYGWRSTYRYMAGAVLLIIAPLNYIFARYSPGDLNLLPDGHPSAINLNPSAPERFVEIIDSQWANKDWTFKTSVATRRFWYLAFAFFCISFAYQSTLLHSVSAMVDLGFSRDLAAFYFGIVGIAGSGGKVLFGYLSDRFGRERVTTMGAAAAAAGIFCLMRAASAPQWLPLFFALLFGIGYGAAAPLLPSISADIFMGSSFGLIFAMIGIGGGIGGSLGPYISGWLHDITGRYTLSFTVAVISLTLASALVWLASPSKVRKVVYANDPRQPLTNEDNSFSNKDRA